MAGGGLSGLTLACELAKQAAFAGKKILIIDREEKKSNDRTWCFWATGKEYLPPVIHKSWDYAWFYGEGIEKKLSLSPYRYCMVRGLDYYQWVRKQIEQYPSVSFLYADIKNLDETNGAVHTSEGTFYADWILNSAFSPFRLLPDDSALFPRTPFSVSGEAEGRSYAALAKACPQRTFFLQHFKGWYVETDNPVFNPQEMTLMDYRIEQKGETRFVYVLPFSDRRALVEFTVFSARLAAPEEYNQVLRDYMEQFFPDHPYRVIEQEAGIIPMTDRSFGPLRVGRMINIGTAGGFVKASSGYAFLRTLRRLRAFAANWADYEVPDERLLTSPARFHLYDRIVLRVLRNGDMTGKSVFSTLFRKIPVSDIFCFLDEDTRFPTEFRIANIFPKGPFLKAAFQFF